MRLVPDDFSVPDFTSTGEFFLRILCMSDAPSDYECYMSSIEKIQGVLGPHYNLWPKNNLDYRFALASLGYCEWEHFKRTSFHYGIFSQETKQQLGRVCLMPGKLENHDVQAIYWIRECPLENALLDSLSEFLNVWLVTEWPFESIAYPGRKIPWTANHGSRFVSTDFIAPRAVQADEFTVRLMTMDDYIIDYDAYMSSAEAIRAVYDPAAGWPQENLTLYHALIALAAVEWEHYHDLLFSYAVLSPDESYEMGCIYITPSRKSNYDAEFTYWVAEKEYENGFGEKLVKWSKDWLAKSWPFNNVAYPGIDFTWREWEEMKNV